MSAMGRAIRRDRPPTRSSSGFALDAGLAGGVAYGVDGFGQTETVAGVDVKAAQELYAYAEVESPVDRLVAEVFISLAACEHRHARAYADVGHEHLAHHGEREVVAEIEGYLDIVAVVLAEIVLIHVFRVAAHIHEREVGSDAYHGHLELGHQTCGPSRLVAAVKEVVVEVEGVDREPDLWGRT